MMIVKPITNPLLALNVTSKKTRKNFIVYVVSPFLIAFKKLNLAVLVNKQNTYLRILTFYRKIFKTTLAS